MDSNRERRRLANGGNPCLYRGVRCRLASGEVVVMVTTTSDVKCNRCRDVRPDDATGWLGNLCPTCAADLGVRPTRRCARCKLHVADWQTTSYYCPQCNAAYQRERRQRLKAEGARRWSVKTCSKCGVTESIPPESGWCRQCRNEYQREWKRNHPGAVKRPPARQTPGREQMRKCSRCKRSKVYKGDWRGNICPQCQAGYRKTAAENEKAKVKEWRESQTPVTCRKCHQVKPYGKGWDKRLCRECQSIRAKATYEEVKADPRRLKNRVAKQESARQRRIASQTAGNAPVDGKAIEVLALVESGLAAWEIADKLRMPEGDVKSIILKNAHLAA